MSTVAKSRKMTANDREVIVRFCPELSRALDASALLLRRLAEWERAEERQASRGIRCMDAVNEAAARKREAVQALKQALRDHWCQEAE